MKKLYFCLLILLEYNLLPAQKEFYDVLNTTTSPAFVVMGVSNTEIARPTSLKDFTASLQNSTNGFTELPNTYGVEFKLWKQDDVTKQTNKCTHKNLSLSFGFNQLNVGEPTEMTKVGLGFNFPILRPGNVINKPEVDKKEKEFKTLILAKEATLNDVEHLNNSLTEIAQQNKDINDAIDVTDMPLEKQVQLIESTNTLIRLQNSTLAIENINKSIRKESGKTKVRRFGGFINLFGGAAWDFPTTFETDSSLSKLGLWLNSGIERGFGKNNEEGDKKEGFFSILGSAKIFHEPNMRYFNESGLLVIQKSSALDAGLKGALTLFNGDFDISGEYVFRNRWGDNTVLKNGNKWLFNARYTFSKDFKVSISFGKDFENNVKKEGNLLSLINFIKGL